MDERPKAQDSREFRFERFHASLYWQTNSGVKRGLVAKVLLVNPSYQNTYGNSVGALVNPIFPVLALASLAAVARQLGHEVRLLDLFWKTYDAEQLAQVLREFPATVVGFTVLTPGMNQVKDMAHVVKAYSSSILTVAGGPHVSAMPEVTLLESVLDVVVYGEGEQTFSEILQGVNLSAIRGLAFKRGDGSVQINPERAPLENLDELPISAWDLFDLGEYATRTSRLFARRTPFVSVEFSRGCVYKCDFCASKLTMGKGYRKKSPQRCAEEIALLERLGVREFMLTDDIFTSDRRWAKDVCRALIESRNTVTWSCTNGIRVESLDQELCQLMRQAGGYRVAFCFESGSDEVLKAFGKDGRASLEQGRQSVALARAAGLETMGFFLMGLSADTIASMAETARYARSLDLDLFKFGATIAFPGTRMFNEYRALGLIRSYDGDQYHIYSGQDLFEHPRLTRSEINRAISVAYRRCTFFNPLFIVRRLWRMQRWRDVWSDVVFFLRYLRSSYVREEAAGGGYRYRDSWPKSPLNGGDGVRWKIREIA